jgi:hypothetical protein
MGFSVSQTVAWEDWTPGKRIFTDHVWNMPAQTSNFCGVLQMMFKSPTGCGKQHQRLGKTFFFSSILPVTRGPQSRTL